jgi:transposase InsO family protein
VYQKPELLAERPNEVWSWDITKLMGPAKWRYFSSSHFASQPAFDGFSAV